MFPYGRTKYTKLDNGTYEFKAPHGEKEHLLNVVGKVLGCQMVLFQNYWQPWYCAGFYICWRMTYPVGIRKPDASGFRGQK